MNPTENYTLPDISLHDDKFKSLRILFDDCKHRTIDTPTCQNISMSNISHFCKNSEQSNIIDVSGSNDIHYE